MSIEALASDPQALRRVEAYARFWSHVRVDESGCWLWTAAKRCGYGAFRYDGVYPVIVGKR